MDDPALRDLLQRLLVVLIEIRDAVKNIEQELAARRLEEE